MPFRGRGTLQLFEYGGAATTVRYGLWKTSASDGCQQSAATRTFSAAARRGTQSLQTRAAKSESQNWSSTFLRHSRHWPEVFFVKDLIA
jgi:hypothetical protein